MARQSSAKARTAVRICSGPHNFFPLPFRRGIFLNRNMAIKYLQKLGLIACIGLAISCFMPWAYYADIQQSFTGFYSFQNQYGKPGKLLLLIAVVAFVFMQLPRVWAKRSNLFVCALGVGYAIKSYILFTSCYNTYCPQKLPGIYLMMVAIILMQIAAVFPDLKIPNKKKS